MIVGHVGATIIYTLYLSHLSYKNFNNLNYFSADWSQQLIFLEKVQLIMILRNIDFNYDCPKRAFLFKGYLYLCNQ